MNSRNTTVMLEHKLTFFATVIALWTLVCVRNFINKAISHTPDVEIHTRPKLCHFGRYLMKAKLFCLKCFVPVTRLECSYGKIFIAVTEISVAKTEISITGPDRPLKWTHRYFCKEKSGEARSRKPSQPGWPGSYEEALLIYNQTNQIRPPLCYFCHATLRKKKNKQQKRREKQRHKLNRRIVLFQVNQSSCHQTSPVQSSGPLSVTMVTQHYTKTKEEEKRKTEK